MNRIHACDKNKRNCVSTFNKEKPQHIKPVSYSEEEQTAMHLMKELLQSMKRVTVKEEDSVFIRCVFVSKWFKFKDDVEIWFDSENKKIHIKSSSRTGYSDFGVNKRRAEHILQSYVKKEEQHNSRAVPQ
ncbi:DUF1499 domain-containing protein [Metabacillus sp. 84]|uniref:DUF1499 domain-containing protein n=1 Tax=unclassified Metabacillus TaxID=2675274 RepID=UPI003CEBBBA0